jgi:8-oxo-dGTP pyrophosphatase MutT (NUDIX family)
MAALDALRASSHPGPAAHHSGQDQTIAAVRDYVARHATSTSRVGRPDHVTASCLVLSAGADSVLLHLHAKVGRWLQFGGHLEPGDLAVADAALREATEESGCSDLRLWSPTPLRVDVHPAPCGARQHLDLQYLAIAVPGAQPHASAESYAVRWFPTAGPPDSCDASVRALLSQALAAVRPTPSA